MSTQTSNYPVADSKVLFGFWSFILSDFIMFAVMFACYAVLSHNTFGGIGIKDIVSLPYIFVSTLFILASSMTYGFSSFAFDRGSKGATWFWLLVTLVLGLIFSGMQYHLFSALYLQGHTWSDSAFLSIYYLLAGAQWVHFLVAMLWVVILMIQFLYQPLSTMRTRLTCLGMFIHFLNIIWIFVFTFVYVMGAI